MTIFPKHDYPPALLIWTVFLSIFLGGLLFSPISSNIVKMIHTFETGKVDQTNPLPLYGFFRPEKNKPVCNDFTFGVDFGQIYYSSKYFSNVDIYKTTKYDVFERPFCYPPILCYLYNKTLCHFLYPQAVILHLFLQIFLLLSASYYVLNYYRLNFMALPVTLIYFIVLFLTPVGLAWAERGQFDIYTALAILFFMFAVYESNAYAFILAAFFASLKPTIAPFFVQAFIVYLLIDFNHKKLLFFFLFAAVILINLLFFPHYSILFLTAVYTIRFWSQGLTLVNRMPSIIILFIPIISLLVYLIPLGLKAQKHISLKTFLPYATGLVTIDILLTPISWEYRTLCLLGFIPMAIAWFFHYCRDILYRREFILLFLLFLFVSFHCFWFLSSASTMWSPKPEYFIASYIAYYLAIAVISISRIYAP